MHVFSMAGLIVRPRARIFHGHEWVYQSEIQKTFGNPEPGDVISLKDFRDRPLGTAIYNPESQIVARRFTRRKQDLDKAFFLRRIEHARKIRETSGIQKNLCRLLWSESDGLPGIILDRYGDHLVLQTLTLAMDQRVEIIKEALLEAYEPQSITLRNDSPMRKAEGMESEIKMLHGEVPAPFEVESAGIKFLVDLSEGQKTGLYLDQLDTYSAVAKHSEGLKVLDCFSNQGGFGLACALAGAKEVTCVDISEGAIQAVGENAKLNAVKIKAVCANVFDFLRESEETYDLIILDPPSFTKNKKTLKDAMRGYKEIHLRALKLLNNDGYLSTYSCSHHATREIFLSMICDAAVDAKKTLRLVENHAQKLDHPVLPTIPETGYLKGFTFQLLPNR